MKQIPILLAFFSLGGYGCTSQDGPPAVRPFSVERYMGRWYEAARMPQHFERGLNLVTAEYTLLPDGTILVRNQGFRDGRKSGITGRARQKVPGTGELEVSFFRPFYGAYRIVILATDYSSALILSSGKKSAWVLVRSPELAPAVLPGYLKKLKEWGFDTSRLEYPEMKRLQR